MFEEFSIVKWNNDTCDVDLGGDGKLPSTFNFEIEADSSQEALAFYSRHHIVTTKLPEIYDALLSKLDERTKVLDAYNNDEDGVCCGDRLGFCPDAPGQKYKVCTYGDLEEVTDAAIELMKAGEGWASILQAADTTKENAISSDTDKSILNWFESQQSDQYIQSAANIEEDSLENVNIDEASSGLAPQKLVDVAVPVGDDLEAASEESLNKVRNTNRIQFSGASGDYQMTLARSSSASFTTMKCTEDNEKLLNILNTVNEILELTDDISTWFERGKNLYKNYQERQKEIREAKDVKETDEKRKDVNKELLAKFEERDKKAKEEESGTEDDKPKSKLKRQNASRDLSKEQFDTVKSERTKIEKRVIKETEQEKKVKESMKKYDERKKEAEEKRNQEREDEDLKKRAETSSAESSSKSQVEKASSIAKMTFGKVKEALAVAPTLISTFKSGCDFESTSDAEPVDLDIAGSIFGIGVEAGLTGGKYEQALINTREWTVLIFSSKLPQIEFIYIVDHQAEKTDEENEETQVSFTFGDSDLDDEFVVDIYFDEIYGTFIFNTVAGVSKCVWEEGTGASEDPKLISLNPASSFIYPDEAMVFEVELTNFGRTSDSLFYVAQEPGSRNLDVKLGGGGIVDENGYVIQLFKEAPVIKQIIISRGINGYEFPAIELTLKSKCEADMGTRQDTETGRYVTIELSNGVDEDHNPVLKWMEPCPKIHWSGGLNRERTFLINIDSIAETGEAYLPVQIFNPLASSGKNITHLSETRNLEHIYLRYRRKGDVVWSHAFMNDQDRLDYLTQGLGEIEDSYGFATLSWKLEGLVEQGEYEIMLETNCDAPTSGPDEIREFQESTITGVYDVTPPEQYGMEALPLRHDIIIGEEIEVYFTEDIECKSNPYSFDMKADIIDTDYQNLDIGDFQIHCEGRKLGFHFDMSMIDPDAIIGKEFRVEIGNFESGSKGITDIHGNEMVSTNNVIVIEKRFAQLNLDSASTTFTFVMENVTCTDESVQEQSPQVRSEIASIIGLESDERVQTYDLTCLDGSQIIADAEILPEVAERRKLRMSNEKLATSSELVREFRNQSRDEIGENVVDISRRSLKATTPKYSVRNILLIPSIEDKDQFGSSSEQLAKEKSMKSMIKSEGEYNPKDTESNMKMTTKMLEESRSEIKRLEDRLLKEKANEEDKLESKLAQLQDRLLKEKLAEKEEMKEMLLVQGLILFIIGSLVAVAVYFQRRIC